MKSSTAEEKLKEAHRIVGLLARGLDPANDCASFSIDVLDRPEVIRALLLAADALTTAMGIETTENDRAGKPWLEAEEDQLRKSLSRRETLLKVAADHGRTTGAITSRLVRMGLAEDHAAARALFGMSYS